jgi:hypothetical protein
VAGVIDHLHFGVAPVSGECREAAPGAQSVSLRRRID